MTNLPIKKSNIINLLKIESASIDKKEELIETAISLVEMKVLEKIANNLKENEIEKFQDLLNEQDENKILDFLKEKNLDISEMVKNETKKVKKEIIKSSKENLEDL